MKYIQRTLLCALTIGCLLLTKNISAQDSAFEKRRKELQIKIGLTIFSSPTPYNIGYKYHFKKGAIRVGYSFSYNNNKNNAANNDMGGQQNYTVAETPKNMTSNISVGYELHSNFNKFQLFYGIDFLYNYSNLTTTATYNNYNDTIVQIDHSTKTITTTNGWGLSPFFGVKYRFNKWFSISAQSSINGVYSIQKIDNTSYYNPKFYPNSSTNSSRSLGLENNLTSFGITPISNVAINFHF